MRLQQYINESKKIGRGKEITEDQALKLAPKFSQAIKSALSGNPLMIRRRDSILEDFYLIDPKKGKPRKSIDTSNYYTLIMDNSKRWSKYPKRSRSLIARINTKSTNFSYVLLPKNGAKIGECSDEDVWYSFPNIGVGMNDWNSIISYILNLPLYTDEEIDNKQNHSSIIYDKNITNFKKACKKFDNWVDNTTMFSIDEIKNNIYEKYFTTWVKWISKWNGEPIFEFFEKTLDPKDNNFKLKNITNLINKPYEVWTDSESLMIHDYDRFQDFLHKANDRI